MLRTAYLLVSTAVLTATAGFGEVAPEAIVPASTASISPSGEKVIARVARERDGMFYLTLDINARPVRFLVDTGASVVVLSRADAAAAGISAAGTPAGMRTAGGQQSIRWALAERVALDGMGYGPAEVAIADGGLTTSLLGQNVLSRMGSVTIRNDTLIVTATPTVSAVSGGD